MSACAALILVVPDYPLLLAVLALFGFSMATLDVAMNAEASAVEIAIGRPIMSSLHGMFSIGGMAGAAAGGALLSAGMAPAVHLALAAATSATVLVVASPAVLPHVPHHEHAHGGGNRWRSPALWMLGGIALVALIAEGAMYDWATVYMRDVVVAGPALASAAYAAFSGGMAIARFAGDAVRARFGAPQLVFASASLACAGMIGALLLPYSATVLTGFTLMGLGLANMMPVLFAAAARVKGIHAAEGRARGRPRVFRHAVRSGRDRRRRAGVEPDDRAVRRRAVRGARRGRRAEGARAAEDRRGAARRAGSKSAHALPHARFHPSADRLYRYIFTSSSSDFLPPL